MKKSTKTHLEHHFIFDYLSALFGMFGSTIEQDEILNNALQMAFDRVNGMISEEAFGNVVEQYVVTVYDDER